jgi:tetratricopeptide (TPR) repeat protein
MGTLFRVEGRYGEAEPLLLDWLRQSEAATGPDSISVARASSSLAALYHAQGRGVDAEPFALRADGILQRHADEEPGEFADNSRILASIWLDQGRYSEGEALLRRLLPNLPDRLAVGAYNDLAAGALRQGRLSEAEPLALQAVEVAHRALPAGHPLLAVTINNLAQIERFQQRYEEAEKHYREAIGLWKQALGSGHPDLAKGLMNLAALYHERGREAGAEDLYRQAAGIFARAYGEGDALTLVARNELGEVLRAERRFSESEKLSRVTLESLEAALGDQDPRVIRALANYAHLLEDTKRTVQAAAIRGRIEGFTEGFRPNP